MAKRIKEKALKVAQIREKRPHAYARHIRISPYKARVVLDEVRGKSVNDAVALLSATQKSASEVLIKLINSAAANAEHNHDMSRVDLYIAEIFADGGPTLKRAMPRAKGRSNRILKRTCHLSVILDSVKNMPVKVTVPKQEAAQPVKATAKTTTAKTATGAAKPATAKTATAKTATAKTTAAKAAKPAAEKAEKPVKATAEKATTAKKTVKKADVTAENGQEVK